MLGYEALAAAIAAEGTEVVFGVIANGVERFAAVLAPKHKIRFVKVRHEEVAIGMADGYSRATGKIGVALVGNGPGMANAGAAMQALRMSKSRVMVVVGGPAVDAERHGPMLIEQTPILKSTIGTIQDCRSPRTLNEDVALAFRHIRLGRGPIALHFYVHIANAEMPEGWAYDPRGLSQVDPVVIPPQPQDIREITAAIKASKKPVIIAGRGAYLSGARGELIQLAERSGALLATTLLARDWFADQPFSLGISGGVSTDEAAEILGQADLVIGFGASMNFSTTRSGKLFPAAKIIHVDIDPAAGEDYNPAFKVAIADAKAAAQALLISVDEIKRPDWRGEAMKKRIAAIDRFKGRDMTERPGAANIRGAVEACDRLLPKNRILLGDIGLFVGVPVAYTTVPTPADVVLPFQLGRVGCCLPVAMGAALGRPDRIAAAFIGDGGFMASLNALDSVAALKLPVAMIVLDDGGFGAERRHLERYGLDIETSEYVTPDLRKVGEALGVKSYKATSTAELEAALKQHDFSTPGLFHVVIDRAPAPTEMINAGWA